jgi:hypothetical protein
VRTLRQQSCVTQQRLVAEREASAQSFGAHADQIVQDCRHNPEVPALGPPAGGRIHKPIKNKAVIRKTDDDLT